MQSASTINQKIADNQKALKLKLISSKHNIKIHIEKEGGIYGGWSKSIQLSNHVMTENIEIKILTLKFI